MKDSEFYFPTHFEIPRSLKGKAKAFGMGISSARTFAQKLNSNSNDNRVIVIGCADASPSLRPGYASIITDILYEGAHWNTRPEWASALQSCVLYTSPTLVKTPNEKQKIHSSTGAHLVDMEMGAIWSEANDRTRSRLVFARVVIDRADDDLSFLDEGRVVWSKLTRPSQFFGFVKFLRNLRIYHQEASRFTNQIVKT